MRDAPLREGLLLLTGLGLLAWPLAVVTGVPEVAAGQVVAIQTSVGNWLTDVEVQCAHEFEWLELRGEGGLLGRIEGPTRTGEFECELPEHGAVLTVAAAFSEGTPETAVKVQLWPGSLPEVEFTLWGEDDLLEEVEVRFHE